jgi:ribosomal protein S18 acetylase RimI-like enzyme
MNYQIKKEKMTDDIIKQIMYIDKLFYKENYTLDWYKARYNENNIAFCLYDNTKMIGYIVAAGIKKQLYDDFKDGKYENDYDITPNLFDYTSKYMYISSANILKEYRDNGFGTKLLDKLFDYYPNDMIAITVSSAGYNLAKKKMTYIKNITNEVAIFERKGNPNN